MKHPGILRSDPGKLFLGRVWLPLISGGGSILLLGENWRGLWVLLPFVDTIFNNAYGI